MAEKKWHYSCYIVLPKSRKLFETRIYVSVQVFAHACKLSFAIVIRTQMYRISKICIGIHYRVIVLPYITSMSKLWLLSLPGIEIHISDVLKINDRDFSITFSLYFNVRWKEPRLQIDSSFFQNR